MERRNISESLRSKIGLLELAKRLNNVSLACEIMGYSRDSYYRFKKWYENGGEAALQYSSRRKPNRRNRVSSDVEKTVLDTAIRFPWHGQRRVSSDLKKKGISISPGGVRGIWLRNNLETAEKRLCAQLLVQPDGNTHIPNTVLKALKAKRQNLISHLGGMCLVDISIIGNAPQYGNVFQYLFMDVYSGFVAVELFLEHSTKAFKSFVENSIKPFFSQYQLVPKAIYLSGIINTARRNIAINALEEGFSGHELNTSVASNTKKSFTGISLRFQRLIQSELYTPFFRNEKLVDINDLRALTQNWCAHYNQSYPGVGAHCYGRTPLQTLNKDIGSTNYQKTKV